MHNVVTSAQIRMARAGLGWTVRELAERSSVHRNTITRIESGADAERRTLETIRAALEAGGVEFTNGDAPGVRLSK